MKPNCRHCREPLETTFCDLGMSPLANSYVQSGNADRMEPFFPLHALVCGNCYLVQLQEFESAENIFSEYAYFSSYSESWVIHARQYVQSMIDRFGINSDSQVIEIASNDGYLLQFFKSANVPCLGIEPAANIAKVAVANLGIETVVDFFGVPLARKLADDERKADLLLGNNVLAHVPDLNDFVRGLKIALKPTGVITLEFPHLLQLMKFNQFDTIYHEHFSYLSLLSVETVFRAAGLRVFDVEELPTHGGSLRIFVTHEENLNFEESARLAELRRTEARAELGKLDGYRAFSQQVINTKMSFLRFLLDARSEGSKIVGYGAPAKGNTLLNYCGVGTEFLEYTVDLNPEKQDRLLPGSRIPIHSPDMIRETKPDYLLILPWNLKDEIISQMDFIRSWGGKFVIPIPDVEVIA